MSGTDVPLPKAPSTIQEAPYADARAEIADATNRSARNMAFEASFLWSKSHIIQTHPTLSLAQRKHAMAELLTRIEGISAELVHQPVPGGVGYGTFYNVAFKSSFEGGTEIIWNAIAPAQPGGNVNTFLYITSTNRSSFGVEALIAYDGTAQMSFKVYDWARPSRERWQVNIPFGDLNQYMQAQNFQGVSYPILPIWNSTTRTAQSTWRNSVYLYDRNRSQWALVYQYDYQCDDAAQKNGWVGSWGPIVETFQSLYRGTTSLGALNVQLRAMDQEGAWSQWETLTAAQAELRVDNVGFHKIHLDPDYDWVVGS